MGDRPWMAACPLVGGVLLAVGVASAWAQSPAQAPEFIGLAQPLAPAAVQTRQLTVLPDGRGLPEGQGTVTQGRLIYAQQCAACHGAGGYEGPAARLVGSDGWFSWRDPWRPVRILQHPVLVVSAGARWPYATTWFDYIRRAMPHHAPKSLSADEVYALTAHLLHRNGLVPADARLDARSLPRVVMPGLAATRLAWPEPVAACEGSAQAASGQPPQPRDAHACPHARE